MLSDRPGNRQRVPDYDHHCRSRHARVVPEREHIRPARRNASFIRGANTKILSSVRGKIDAYTGSAVATARIGDRFNSFKFAGTLSVLRSPCRLPTAAISRAGERVGGDAGGSEAALSSMASDRASGIGRGHSTKVVARLSFGRAAPTRAQLIPFVSRCYGSIPGWTMTGQFDVSSLMAQGKKGRDAACYCRRERGRAHNPERGCAYPRT